MRLLPILVCLLLVACGGRVEDTRSFVDREANTGPAATPGPREPLRPIEHEPKEEADVPDVPEVVARGNFRGSGHTGEGVAEVVKRGDELSLQLRGFKTDPGPDLKVWLSTDERASDTVRLGPLQEFDGDQSYTVPKKTDVETYSHVLIWCERFSVLFASAELN